MIVLASSFLLRDFLFDALRQIEIFLRNPTFAVSRQRQRHTPVVDQYVRMMVCLLRKIGNLIDKFDGVRKRRPSVLLADRFVL